MHDSATTLTQAERTILLRLSRAALGEALGGGGAPKVDESGFSPKLRAPGACFVTLHRHGELRGCIGNLEPREPLFRAVHLNAVAAALRDTRFAPVSAAELPELEIHLSVLNKPKPLGFDSPGDLLRQLRPGVDGVVLRVEGRGATFLPQVWGQFPDPVRFLDALARKAMLPASAWREPGAVVLTYQVESFAEANAG